MISLPVFAAAQTAVILPNARTQFIDANGAPIVGGTVSFYTPSTLVPKTTWQDPGETTPNTNPVTLDALGSALIWGSGTYREILKSSDGSTIWDGLTSGTVSSVGSTNGILRADGSGNISAVTIGSGLVYTAGTLSATGGGSGGYGTIYDVVKAYGGDPTGVADNTAAYGAALAACSAGAKGIIWFQGGAYKFTSGITDNVAGCGILGAGPVATQFKPTGPLGNFLTVDFGSSVNPTEFGNFGIFPGTGWVAGYGIAGAPTASHFHDIYMLSPPQAFLITKGADSHIDHLFVWPATSSPVVRCDGSGGVVYGTSVNNSSFNGSTTSTVIEQGSGCNTLRLYNIGVSGGGGGICFHATTDAGTFTVFNDLECDHTQNGVIFDGGSGVQIENSWFGSTIVGSGLTFSSTFTGFATVVGSHIRDNNAHNVVITGSGGVSLTGNIISGGGSTNVYVSPNTNNFQINGNTIGIPGDPTSSWCVGVNTGTSDYYSIQGNVCGTTNTLGVVDNGSGVHKIVSGNVGP